MQRVENYPQLRQVSQGYYINVSDDDYQQAINRLNYQQRLNTLENKVGNLESKIDALISLLKGEYPNGTT